MDIFISHISEDKRLALSIKEVIEEAFINVDVFVSSDDKDITEEQKWFKSIEESLDSSDIIFVMCSEKSTTSSWVNFEAGAGWIKGIDVYPICYNGLGVGSLPSPISSFPALSVEDEDFLETVFERISNSLDFDRTPPVHPKHEALISNSLSGSDDPSQGFIDHVVRINEISNEIDEVFNLYTSETSEITKKSEEFNKKVRSSKVSQDEASVIFVQRKSEDFADQIEKYSENVDEFSSRLDSLLDKFDESVSYIVEYGDKEIDTLEGKEEMEEIKYQYQVLGDSCSGAKSQIDSFKQVVIEMSNEASEIEGFQKDLTYAIGKLKESNNRLSGVLERISDNFEDIERKSNQRIDAIESRIEKMYE